MPRFYFHVHDDLDVPDEEGAELPDLEEARAYCSRSARSLMSETLASDGRINLDHRIDIEDERGAVLAAVRFGDAVRIEMGEPSDQH